MMSKLNYVVRMPSTHNIDYERLASARKNARREIGGELFDLLRGKQGGSLLLSMTVRKNSAFLEMSNLPYSIFGLIEYERMLVSVSPVNKEYVTTIFGAGSNIQELRAMRDEVLEMEDQLRALYSMGMGYSARIASLVDQLSKESARSAPLRFIAKSMLIRFWEWLSWYGDHDAVVKAFQEREQ